MKQLETLAALLDDAAQQRRPIAQISAQGELSVADAYRVQRLLIDRRHSRGERHLGIKLGFTSRAKMLQMGVHDLIWGQLTDRMIVEDGGRLRLEDFVHPRVEPEVAMLLRAPLSGNVTAAQALAAVEAIAPALEIIDSRYRDFKFNLADVVADNGSSAALVVGPWSAVAANVSNLGVLLEIDGRAVQYGSTAAIMGNPLRALVAGARLAAEAGQTLQPGTIVLAGAATAAEPLRAGCHVRVTVETIGSASFSVTGAAVQ